MGEPKKIKNITTAIIVTTIITTIRTIITTRLSKN